MKYEKILTDLWSFLRGLEFNNKEFLDYFEILDDIIIDMRPLSEKFDDTYNKMLNCSIMFLILSPINDSN